MTYVSPRSRDELERVRRPARRVVGTPLPNRKVGIDEGVVRADEVGEEADEQPADDGEAESEREREARRSRRIESP